ncbi:MAG: glycosyl hydrolase, partial [Dehalococcoidia bacterium]
MAIALTHGGANIFSPSTPASELLVGTLNGIVFLERSTEGDWRESGKALEGRHIHALVYEPKSGLWFAGLYNDGVFVSADQGKTWEQRNNGLTETSVFSLGCVELPGGNARLYAGTEPAHLFFSDDLGQTWTELPALRDAESLPKWRFAAKPFQAHAKHLAFAPGDPVTIYVSVEVGGLHKSTDGGQTFTEIPVPHL